MTLFKNNQLDSAFVIDDDEVLRGFANSEIYQDKSRDEKVRLAFYLSFDEPNGLQSTFHGCQFNKLYDNWCMNKFNYVGY